MKKVTNLYTDNVNQCLCFRLCLKLLFHLPTVADCGDLPPPANGSVLVSNTTERSVATYTCDDGYILTGDPTRTCLESGNWSNTEPSCTEGSYTP